MKRSRAFDVLRELDPARADRADPGAEEAQTLLARITEHQRDPLVSQRGRPRARRLAPALVALVVVVPVAIWLLAAYGPFLGHRGTPATSGPPITAPPPTGPTGSPSPQPSPPGRFEWSGTVLQMGDGPAMLCLSGVLTSLPPQCGNVPITNWDWSSVEGEQRAGTTIWGDFHVVGTYDGSTFTVEQAGPPVSPSADTSDEIPTPCPAPPGGWTAPDPGRTTRDDLEAAMHAAGAEPDGAGFWITRVPGSPPQANEGPGVIVDAAFTGDLDRHRAELERLWGGPLCVTRFDHSEAELRGVQRQFADRDLVQSRFGLTLLSSGVNVFHNQVEVDVVWADESQRAAVDARYGPGVVVLQPALTPVH